jgi:hypothetical protein
MYEILNQWAEARVGGGAYGAKQGRVVLVPFGGQDVNLLLWLRARGFRVVGVTQQASKMDAAVRQCNDDVDSIQFERIARTLQGSKRRRTHTHGDIEGECGGGGGEVIVNCEIERSASCQPLVHVRRTHMQQTAGSITLLSGPFGKLGLMNASFDYSVDSLCAYELRDDEERKR